MTNLFDISDKTALVAGGNRGIGLAIARALADAGARVMIWGRASERNQKVAEELRSHGGTAFALAVDIANEDQIHAGFKDAEARLGRIDAVIANAAAGGSGNRFHAQTTDEYRGICAVNMDGTFWIMREACRHMAERHRNDGRGGSLVLVSSVAAVIGAKRNQVYGATKAAAIGMMRGIANEYGPMGIRANAIMPGFTDTDFLASAKASDHFVRSITERTPLRRLAEPADYAGIAIYLVSDASRFHTGDAIVVDGGYTIG